MKNGGRRRRTGVRAAWGAGRDRHELPRSTVSAQSVAGNGFLSICGVAFAGAEAPGVDLIFPDLSAVDAIRKDLLGLVITHAHEDHVGAIADLWPRLNCPVYATRFAASLIETKRLSEPGAPKVDLRVVTQGSTITLGPFGIEFVPVSHSIPESNALAIRTPLGLVLHSGDWKRDATPVIGLPTDEARLTAIGDEGVLALISDSTNILREGESPSEIDVAETLRRVIADAPARVVVTTFASNVARLRSVAEAAQNCGRSVVIVGRAMERTIQVARECGYLDGIAPFLGASAVKALARDRTVILATGSQGESRAALARVAIDDHPEVRLDAGDRVIFSSRAIPGNEKEVNAVINGLVAQGVEVMTDRDALVHASGHPRRGEVAQLYRWVRPQLAIPAHGEPMHLEAHAEFARAQGVPHVLKIRNGDVALLAPGEPRVIDQRKAGRLYKDGDLVLAPDDEAINERARLAFAGIVSIGLALTAKGDLAGDPDVVMAGLPRRGRDGRDMDAIVDKVIFETIDGLPRAMRRDADTHRDRDRARGAQQPARGLGQAADRACARDGSLTVGAAEESSMIGRLNHVAIAVRDIHKASALYRDTLGAKVSDVTAQPDHGVSVVFIELPNTKIELLEPLGEGSPIAKFLEKNPDGGMHHVCYEVDDILAARDTLKGAGARVLGDGEPKIGAHGKPVLFLHPKDFCGSLVELEQV